MRISIFGLGYVGAVISGCFSRDGPSVTGVDTDESKVAVINCGRSPIIEPELEPMIAASVQAGTLRATTNCGELAKEENRTSTGKSAWTRSIRCGETRASTNSG